MKKIYTLFPIWLLVAVPLHLLGQGIEITSGGSIACTGAATIEVNNGSFTNNGTYTKGSETVTMSGSTTARTLSGTSISDFNNLSITNTAGVSIDYNTKVTVNNTLTVDGSSSLTLSSTSGGTASLIENTTPVTATVQRYLADYVVIGDYMFHLLSSPVTAQAIRPGFVTNTPTAGEDFYAWDELNNLWINSKDGAGAWNGSFESNFTVGKGYLVAYPDPVTKTFTGTLNTYASPLVLNCTNTPGKGEGWNLLGNPFPCAIDWAGVSLGDGMDNALYYYDNAQQKYRYYIQFSGDNGTTTIGSGQQYIPAMQGFMVHAKTTGTKTVSIDNGDRTHSGQSVYYKSANIAPESMVLTVAGNGMEDEAFIHFNSNASSAFDGDYDAYKLKSYHAGQPNLYTLGSDQSELAINGLPELTTNTLIPLYFEAEEGSWAITADMSQMKNKTGLLEDTKLNYFQDLSINPTYAFEKSQGDNENRFLLHFKVLGTGDEPEAVKPSIYVYGKVLYVASVAATAQIEVYSISGQLILQKRSNGSSLESLDMVQQPAGVYFVTVIDGKSGSSSKIVLH